MPAGSRVSCAQTCRLCAAAGCPSAASSALHVRVLAQKLFARRLPCTRRHDFCARGGKRQRKGRQTASGSNLCAPLSLLPRCTTAFSRRDAPVVIPEIHQLRCRRPRGLGQPGHFACRHAHAQHRA
eukprot:6770419-Prymnesium_polylepis.2